MTTPISLVDRLKSSDDYRKEIIDALNAALRRAENGETDSVVIIERQPNKYWLFNFGGERSVVEMVGRIEILKQEWIAEYLKKSEVS